MQEDFIFESTLLSRLVKEATFHFLVIQVHRLFSCFTECADNEENVPYFSTVICYVVHNIQEASSVE